MVRKLSMVDRTNFHFWFNTKRAHSQMAWKHNNNHSPSEFLNFNSGRAEVDEQQIIEKKITRKQRTAFVLHACIYWCFPLADSPKQELFRIFAVYFHFAYICSASMCSSAEYLELGCATHILLCSAFASFRRCVQWRYLPSIMISYLLNFMILGKFSFRAIFPNFWKKKILSFFSRACCSSFWLFREILRLQNLFIAIWRWKTIHIYLHYFSWHFVTSFWAGAWPSCELIGRVLKVV